MYKVWEKRALAWMAVALVFAFILPNHYSPWLSAHQEMAAALAFAPLLLLFGWRTTRQSALIWLVLAVALFVYFQYAIGIIVFATDAWMAILYLSAFASVINVGAYLAKCDIESNDKEQRLRLLDYLWCSLLLAAVLSVGIAAHQWLLPQYQGIYIVEIPPHARPFANLAQPNQLASLVLLGLAGLMFLWESEKVSTLIAVVVAFWLDWGLVMTGSRSVLLSFLWLFPAFLYFKKQSRLKLPLMALFVFYIIYFLLMWSWPFASELLLLEYPSSTPVDRMGAADLRTVFWSQMLDAVSRAPWLGWGWGQIGMAQMETALNHPPTHINFESAHNLFFDLALWIGLPFSFLCAFVLIWWFLRQVRTVRSPQTWASLMGIGFIFSHAMVEYPLYYSYFLLPVGFLMGALSGGGSRQPVSPCNLVLQKVVMVFALMVVTLLSVRVMWEYFPIEADWQLMRFQEARIGSRAITEPPPAEILISLREFLKWSRVEPAVNMPAHDIENIRAISERFPYAAPIYRLALSQALNNQADAAKLTLAKLCRVQRKRACKEAREDWNKKSENEFPQLKAVVFPG